MCICVVHASWIGHASHNGLFFFFACFTGRKRLHILTGEHRIKFDYLREGTKRLVYARMTINNFKFIDLFE